MKKSILSLSFGIAIGLSSTSAFSAEKVNIGAPSWTGAQAIAALLQAVVVERIGAKGLGEDGLEALQYANVGQGILAGFAILFCAKILDRIVQGERK